MGVRSVIKHNWRPPPLTRDDYRAVNESRMARCSGGGRELMRSRDRFPEYKLLPSSCFHLLPRSSGQADARASAGFYTHVEESHGPVQECTDRITHDTHHKVFIYQFSVTGIEAISNLSPKYILSFFFSSSLWICTFIRNVNKIVLVYYFEGREKWKYSQSHKSLLNISPGKKYFLKINIS